jgi:hypothetical protein
MDFTGSILDHSCLDPENSSYMFPLFYRMIVLLNVGNDVYFDSVFSYTPRNGNEWTSVKTFTLSKVLPYTLPTDSIVILLYPTSCKTSIPRLVSVEFIPSSVVPPTKAPIPAPSSSPTISKTASAFKKYWYVFLIQGLMILFLIGVILILVFQQRSTSDKKKLTHS